MEPNDRIRGHVLIALLWLCCGPTAFAQPTRIHDGQHDSDLEIANWKTHVKKPIHPLSNSNEWEGYEGTVSTTPFMEGKGNLSEMNVDGATSHTHIQIIAVRLYNPSSRQWSIYGAGAKSGLFDPPEGGQFT